ncbi:hypothetical protein HGRIS_003242 [Hohenbuehelia grisea]|uniref:Uncharacterized protein n=1 Tax=Hohenbuehelia grisea TaxID=104357 RepID=A0ABR3JNW0_9AGAR
MLADIEPPSVIAFADFGHDFRRSIDPEKGHSSYILPSSEDYEALFIGETCSSEAGTVLRAHINHFLGKENFTPCSDGTRARAFIVLRRPTSCPENMGILFDNQIGTLNEIRVLDEEEEAAGTELWWFILLINRYVLTNEQRFSIREWLRPTMSEGDHTVMDGIAVRMPLKYARSSDASPKSKLTRITKWAIPSERATPSADKGAPGVGHEPPVRVPSRGLLQCD